MPLKLPIVNFNNQNQDYKKEINESVVLRCNVSVLNEPTVRPNIIMPKSVLL